MGLTARDLSFSAEEIQQFLALAYQMQITEDQACELAERSEGWITGVLLLVDAWDEVVTREGLPGRVGGAAGYHYLAEQVLRHQPPDIQHFLHASAVLHEMSPQVCEEALGLHRADVLLSELERRNLFLTRFGKGAAATYRYHPLFREFLLEQLRVRDANRFAALHLEAGEWFERARDVDEAVYHFVEAKAYPRAATVMERASLELFARGRLNTLQRWAELLPEEVKSQAPRVLLFQSKVLTDRLEFEDARRALEYAEQGFIARGDRGRLAEVYNENLTRSVSVL